VNLSPGSESEIVMDDLYIADQSALVEFCAGLRGAAWLALDTEFVREQTYYPQLGLLQIASADRVACIDPLALPTLEPLLERIYDPAVTKVLHAAHQDLEIFFHWRGAVPEPVFDTQLAALVLGDGHQVGYAALVRQQLGVDLDKTHTRVDWRCRPLVPEWLTYAADDVRYLPELYRRQHAALVERGWLAALTEDFQALTAPERYRQDPEEAWRRVREHQRLGGAQRAVLRALAAWRERQASSHDRPRRWILADAPLIELARRMPATLAELSGIPGLPATTRQRHGETLLDLIVAARAVPPEQWPALPHRPRLAPARIARVDELLALIEERATAHGIAPLAVAGRREVENLLAGQDSPLCHGWRAALVGHELQARLADVGDDGND
jgi:ribonuclease D